MDKMTVRVPVAVKAKVTEDLKLKIIGDLQNTIKNMELDLEQFEFQAKKAPFYRIVVADARSPRDGRFIESIGYYDSTTTPANVKIDAEKAIDWMGKGAQPTDTVKNLFSKQGIMKAFAEAKAAK